LLVGRFNYATGGKLLICGNEVDARTKHKSDALKDVVTEDTRNLEPKGKEAVEIDDFTNLIITTNNIDCVKIEETDRRYFIQDIPLPKMDTETRMKYFEDLTDACDNPLSAPEFYAWLKHTVENDMSIRNIKLRKIPYTKAKQSRILDDQHPMYRWLQERYVNNPSWETNDNVVQYDLLRSFQTDDLYKNIKTTSQQFTKMFEKLGFQAGPERLGRCWKMMPLEEYKSAMIACGKWDDTL
jgi:putative DNA primase/helicase